VREAVRLLGEVAAPDPVVEGLVRMQQCETDVAGGRPLDRSIVARGLRLERRAAPAAVSERFSAALGVWRKYLDDFAGARVWLERTVRTARDEGDEGSMPYALSHLPELELWTGRWAEGEAIARRHLELATELGLESQRRQALYNLALLHVHQGREREARDEIRAGLEAAAGDGDTWTEASLVPLLGHLELSLGNAAGAVPLLRRASALRDRVGQETPRRHDADLVEALISAGDPDAAAAVVATMEARARRFARHSALAAAARARGMVEGAQGDLDAAVAALLDALREHDLAPIPFDRARTLLALGVVRRRRRERGAAKDALAEAVRVFDGLGALLWAERARAELDRVGLRRASATELTEGERRVAELAARGLTNREVAAALYVSPKTVEANLARAYAKLGVGSRAELGALLGRPETERGLQP
jgi:DNA-binding CsgD family transcriptional regulator